MMAASIYPASEYLRPWKLTTLLVGIGLLIVGSYYMPAPDWDIPISFIMAGCTYLTAPWSMRILLEHHWRFFPLMALVTWFSVDGGYAIYCRSYAVGSDGVKGRNEPSESCLLYTSPSPRD